MTNQVNQEFEKWFGETYNDLQFNKAGMIDAWQAATQANESEINSLKQRVEELQADNLQLREALEIARDYQFDAVNQFHSDFAGYKEDKHKQYDEDLAKTDNALSSTPEKSLAEHDNEVVERCAKVCDEQAHEPEYYEGALYCAEEIRALKGEPL